MASGQRRDSRGVKVRRYAPVCLSRLKPRPTRQLAQLKLAATGGGATL
jgi:hypothetical protein